jgi:methylated-DNA-[protein]-cysteine S-methyltransferase
MATLMCCGNMTGIGHVNVAADSDGNIVQLSVGHWIKGVDVKVNKYSYRALEELNEYLFQGRKEFDVKLAPQGTDFEKKVWAEVQKIPYGKTVTYAQLAKSVGKPDSVRAVANAVAKNPIPIIIPCHRVIESSGKIGGYVYGPELKEKLLKIEGSL